MMLCLADFLPLTPYGPKNKKTPSPQMPKQFQKDRDNTNSLPQKQKNGASSDAPYSPTQIVGSPLVPALAVS